MSDPLVVIPSYLGDNRHIAALGKTVATLRATTDAPVIIIDDGSPLDDAEKDLVYYDAIQEGFDGIEIHYKKENTGFSSTVNIGLTKALKEGSDVILVNADMEFRDGDWFNELLGTQNADIVGGLLLYPNLLIQHAGIYFSIITRNFAHRFAGCPPNTPAALVATDCPVTGALQYIKREVLEDIGLYDEDFKLGFEDVDFMIRAIQAGHQSVYNPKVKAIHHESLFRSGESMSDHIKKWETESLAHLLIKYQGTDFTGIAPTMMEKQR